MMMRSVILVIILVAVVLSPAPALAQRCEWFKGRPYCDPGCAVLQRGRHQDGTWWFTHSCVPPFVHDLAVVLGVHPLLVASAGMGALAGILVIIFGTAGAASVRHEVATSERETETAQDIKKQLDAAADEADRYIAEQVAKAYERGRRSVKDHRDD